MLEQFMNKEEGCESDVMIVGGIANVGKSRWILSCLGRVTRPIYYISTDMSSKLLKRYLENAGCKMEESGGNIVSCAGIYDSSLYDVAAAMITDRRDVMYIFDTASYMKRDILPGMNFIRKKIEELDINVLFVLHYTKKNELVDDTKCLARQADLIVQMTDMNSVYIRKSRYAYPPKDVKM